MDDIYVYLEQHKKLFYTILQAPANSQQKLDAKLALFKFYLENINRSFLTNDILNGMLIEVKGFILDYGNSYDVVNKLLYEVQKKTNVNTYDLQYWVSRTYGLSETERNDLLTINERFDKYIKNQKIKNAIFNT